MAASSRARYIEEFPEPADELSRQLFLLGSDLESVGDWEGALAAYNRNVSLQKQDPKNQALTTFAAKSQLRIAERSFAHYMSYHLAPPIDKAMVKKREMLQAVIDGSFEPPSARAPERAIPTELEAICRRAMAVGQADRYPSAEALALDLARYLRGADVTAPLAPQLKTLRRGAVAPHLRAVPQWAHPPREAAYHGIAACVPQRIRSGGLDDRNTDWPHRLSPTRGPANGSRRVVFPASADAAV